MIDLNDLRKIVELLKTINYESDDPNYLKEKLKVSERRLKVLMDKADLLLDLLDGAVDYEETDLH